MNCINFWSNNRRGGYQCSATKRPDEEKRNIDWHTCGSLIPFAARFLCRTKNGAGVVVVAVAATVISRTPNLFDDEKKAGTFRSSFFSLFFLSFVFLVLFSMPLALPCVQDTLPHGFFLSSSPLLFSLLLWVLYVCKGCREIRSRVLPVKRQVEKRKMYWIIFFQLTFLSLFYFTIL